MSWSLALERESRVSDRCANEAESRPLALIWRAVGFVAMFSLLQLAWQRLSGSRFEYFVIHTCTVRPAALLVNVLMPDVRASASGYLLQAPGVRLDILNGCDGLEALFLVVAAFAVAPLDWRRRLGGAALGVPVVFAVNQARILTLFYAFRSHPPLFAALHATVTPIAVIVLVCCYFYAWLAHSSRSPSPESA
jgi:exosortase family protein XrtM